MKASDYIAIFIIIVIAALIIFFIIRQKKKGIKCIGCPYGKSCQKCNCEIKKQ